MAGDLQEQLSNLSSHLHGRVVSSLERNPSELMGMCSIPLGCGLRSGANRCYSFSYIDSRIEKKDLRDLCWPHTHSLKEKRGFLDLWLQRS